MSSYTIRPIRASEWREVRALRLAGLRDEAAPLAFVESYDEGAAMPDSLWIDRAAGSSVDAGPAAAARQFVAVADDGGWVGTVVVIVESAGEKDFEGRTVESAGGHVVGVFIEPRHRASGLVERLFEAAIDWARERGLTRVRLYVHTENRRAEDAYRKCGFEPTGVRLAGALGQEIEMARSL
jgi:GNAT superfamily N-acetyltransferase